MNILVDAFANGAAIPRRYTCEGDDISPSVRWSEAPSGTKSLALIVDDPDAPAGTWVHWLLYDIAGSSSEVPEGVRPAQAGLSGTNSFGRPGYGGPCPPKGHGPHRYFFRLFALDVAHTGLNAGARREDLERAMRGHILGQAEYMGRYERR